MKTFLWIGESFVLGVLALVLLPAFSSAQEDAPSSPNILVILTDDQGYADVGFNGSKEIPTPHIDRIAEEGVRFTDGYVTHSFCSPSRAGLLTGRYQQRFGHERNPIYNPTDPDMGMPTDEVTMARTLGKAGYVSGAIGKWHLGAHEKFHPLNRGFDEFYGFLGGGHMYFPDDRQVDDPSRGDEYHTRLLRNHQRVDEPEYLTNAFSREAVTFIKEHKQDPFFLYLAYNAPHTPVEAPRDTIEQFDHIEDKKRRTYAAMIHEIDQGVGRVLNTLDELDLEKETLVFFLSDNGGPLKRNGSSNDPLRGKKGTPFEGGIRVPFAVRWTGHLPAGTDFEKPVSSLDIYATARALADAPQPDTKPLDGTNLVPYLTGEKEGAPHDILFWRDWRANGVNRFAVRQGDGPMKLVIPRFRTEENPLLFNLETDLQESRNLASERPEALKRLGRRRRSWNKQLMRPVFRGLLLKEEYWKKHSWE